MKKLDPKFISEVCSKHKVDHVLATSDGQCFLPKAITHAKFHAFKSNVELFKVDTDGEYTPVKEKSKKVESLKPSAPAKSKGDNSKSNDLPLKKWNKTQLKIRVAELLVLKVIDAPAEDATNKDLVAWIETAEKAEDKPEGEGSEGEGSEGEGSEGEGSKGEGSEGEGSEGEGSEGEGSEGEGSEEK